MGYDFYLKLDGIDGECTDSKHAKWIEVLSYSTGVEQQGGIHSAGGASTAGRANFQDVSIVKYLDASTPKLQKYCAQGEHIAKGELQLCQATKDKHPYMKYILTDVVISSVRPQGKGNIIKAEGNTESGLPTEEVAMRFAKIEWEYTPMNEKGQPQAAQKANWDLKANKGG